MYRGEKISLENRALLLAIFCLLFFVIGGVSASDVVDMSNNPDNNNIVSDSLDQVSVESVGNYYSNQLSNEDVSSLDSPGTNDNVVGYDNDLSQQTTSSADSASSDVKATSDASSSSDVKATSDSSSTSDLKASDSSASDANKTVAKSSTKLSVSKSKIYSGTPMVITLKDNNGKVISGKKIKISIPSKKKTYTRTTDSKGQVKLTLNKIGTYKINVDFAGDSSYESSTLSSSVKVLKSDTRLIIKKTSIPRSTRFFVTLKNKKSGLGVKNQMVLFKIPKWKNRTYVKYTDSKGQATLVITAKNKFNMIISFAGTKDLSKSKVKTKVKPKKCKTKIVPSTDTIKYGEDFVVTLKKYNNGLVKYQKVKVKLTNKNKKKKKKTNSKGQIFIPIHYLGTIKAKISFAGDEMFIKSSGKAQFNVVKGVTHFEAPEEVGKGFNYYITLKNSAGKVLKNTKVKIKFKGKTYTKKTNSRGKVSMLMNYKLGTYPIVVSFSGSKYYNSSKLSTKVKIGDPSVSVSDIVTTAKDLKKRVDYISILTDDYTVTIDKKVYSMDEFAYLMAGALTNIKSGSKANVKIKDLSNNYKSKGPKINGKLSKSEYLKLAKEVTKFVNSKKRIPYYESTKLGKVEANLYIYTFAKVLDSYGNNGKLPSSVKVKTFYIKGGYSSSLIQKGKILNCRQIFNSASFAKYLQTGGKSAYTEAMKKKAKALTAGLKTPMAKAIAIFRFVRDDVAYSFYTNSLKGAKGTYSSRSGNCCDKANLIVAMCRSVGVHARYSHAQGCRFSSGLYTGHVWAQVYDTQTQTWYSADATSHRNEVGNIKNWNTKSHYRDNNYVLIPF